MIFPVKKSEILGVVKDSPGHKIYKVNEKTFDLRNAIDIFTKEGIPVFAIDDGRVVKVCNNVQKNYPNIHNHKTISLEEEDGNYVAIEHNNGLISFYAHLKYRSVCVKRGETVKKGQKIGEVGNTGLAGEHPKYGKYHLHFYIGKWVNNEFRTFPIEKFFKDNFY